MNFLLLSSNVQDAHSMLVHFPLVLILLVPALLMCAALASHRRRRRLLISSLVTMAIATILLYAVGVTGERARDGHQLTAEFRSAVAEHRELAKEATAVFGVATSLLALLLLLTLRLRLRVLDVDSVVTIGALTFYSIGVLLLLKTFYRGGDLVHQLGM